MPKKLPPVDLLRKLLRYEPDTGKLFWRERTSDMFTDGKYSSYRKCLSWNKKNANKEAFTAANDGGYKIGRIFGAAASAHRVAYALFYGKYPDKIIDHINGDTSDNRIQNIRCVSQVENQRNQFLRKDNKSGAVGVYFCRSTNKWIAQCYTKKSKRIFLGRFPTKEDAAKARANAQKGNMFTERHGKCRKH